VYFNVTFNVFFKKKKVHFLVSELCMPANSWHECSLRACSAMQQVPLALWFVCECVIILLMLYLHLKLLALLSALKCTSDFAT